MYMNIVLRNKMANQVLITKSDQQLFSKPWRQ